MTHTHTHPIYPLTQIIYSQYLILLEYYICGVSISHQISHLRQLVYIYKARQKAAKTYQATS